MSKTFFWDAVIEDINRRERAKRRWVPSFIQPTVDESPTPATQPHEEVTTGSCVVDFDILG